MLNRLGNWTPLYIVFGADLRALALFRVLLGLYLLLNLLSRARDLTAHYTDFGVISRHVQMGLLADGSWSLHLFNGTGTAQAILFGFSAMAAAGLILGWRTRLMTVISWVLLLSVQNRNTFILSGEDNLALLLCFWAMFLPLGARYSVDHALDQTEQDPSRQHAYWSWATTALLVQGMSMYFFSALLKSDSIWMPDGTAIYYALNLDYMVTSFALWFRQFETLMQGLTYYVWILELVGPILIFTPIFQKPVRALLMILFITMHLGFWLFLEIGLFPMISIIMNLTFTPGWMWDWLGSRLKRTQPPTLTIWYDGDCGFCLKMCQILKQFLLLPNAQVKPAQADPVIREIMIRNNSWVVAVDGDRMQKWAAFTQLLRASPVFHFLAIPCKLRWVERIGDRIYILVAKHRSDLSAITSVVLPWNKTGQPRGQRLGSTVLVITLLGIVTVQNLSTLPQFGINLPNGFVHIRQALGLYQNWTMFAPYPEQDSPRPIIEGQLQDGTIVDVYAMETGPAKSEWTTHAARDYENGRWRKFLANLEDESYRTGDKVLALNYARYLCRLWNLRQPHGKQLSTFAIRFEVQKTLPPGQMPEVRLNEVWFHDCFDTG